MGTVGVIVMISSLVSVAMSVALIVLIVQRNQSFLRIYQILAIVSIVVGVASAVVSASSLLSSAAVVVTSALTGIGMGVLGIVLMTMYFCKSVRVRTYMGGTEYIENALFKIGV